MRPVPDYTELLLAPLLQGADPALRQAHRERCQENNWPYAVCAGERKQGTYTVDLQDTSYRLTAAGVEQLRGATTACLARWRLDGTWSPKQPIMLKYDTNGFTLRPCPRGQEEWVHQCFCLILADHWEVKEGNPCGGNTHHQP